jgi:hypothetical protein
MFTVQRTAARRNGSSRRSLIVAAQNNDAHFLMQCVQPASFRNLERNGRRRAAAERAAHRPLSAPPGNDAAPLAGNPDPSRSAAATRDLKKFVASC